MVENLDIKKLKKIEGEIFEVNKVSMHELKAIRQNLMGEVNSYNLEIEIIESNRNFRQKKIDLIENLINNR